MVFGWLQKHYHWLLIGAGLIFVIGTPILEDHYVPDSHPGKGELSFFIFMPLGLMMLLLGGSAAAIKMGRTKRSRTAGVLAVFGILILVLMYLFRGILF